MTPKSESDIAFVMAQLGHVEPWLDNLGYKQACLERNESKLLTPFFTVIYSNESAQRKLHFSYGRLASEPLRESFGLGLGGSDKAYFSLGDYLTYKRAPEELRDRLSFSWHNGTREQRVSAVLSEWRALLEGELHDVVVGKTWIEIPLDWGGYK